MYPEPCTPACALVLEKRNGDGVLAWEGLAKAVVFWNSCNIRRVPPSSPPATATQKRSPISPRCEPRGKREQVWNPTARDQGTVHDFLRARISVFLIYSQTQPWGNAFILEFPSLAVQEIWSEQVAACKVKCGAPGSPPVLRYMIDSLLLFSLPLSLPLTPLSFLSHLSYRSSELRLWDLDCGSS